MPPLPVISGRKAVAAFEKLGWAYVRRESSHMIMYKPGERLVLSIPDDRELDRGTLRSQIRDAGFQWTSSSRRCGSVSQHSADTTRTHHLAFANAARPRRLAQRHLFAPEGPAQRETYAT